MHNDNKDKKIPLASLEDSLDTMFFGAKTLREAKLNDMLKRRNLRRTGVRNKAK